MRRDSVIEVDVERTHRDDRRTCHDLLAVEEPLEIRLNGHTVSITMRTPGHDEELAVGYLFSEGIVREAGQIAGLRQCAANVVRVDLTDCAPTGLARLARRGVTNSSCGVCGKTSIEAVTVPTRWTLPPAAPMVDASFVLSMPRALRAAQTLFDATGGLHASALFDVAGRLLVVREDVGRHNALDKVLGAELLAGALPAYDRILLVSGRVSFELVQKAAAAGIPIVVAIGAPSSLAVQMAERAGMTLIAFVRDERFNVYTGATRLSNEGAGGFMSPSHAH